MPNQNYSLLYNDLIVKKAKTVIVEYSKSNETYKYHPYSHHDDMGSSNELCDLLIDNMVFYAFSENEILKLHSNINILDDLRSAAKYAYAQRLPQRLSPNSDGTLGEVLLDLLIQVYNPNAKKLIARAKQIEIKSKKEITGYDALYFTQSPEGLYLWLGQAKAGDEKYCKSDIKKDLINKFTVEYFANTAFYISDRSESVELTSLLNTINKICFESQQGLYGSDTKIKNLIELLQTNNVKIKIPCLMAFTSDIYGNAAIMQSEMEKISKSIISYFDLEKYPISIGLDFDILFYIFPIDNVPKIREKIVELKKEVK